ncbi:MAG: polysaccharide deacetylase family protein [Proteobacteria bacterium]|nr:MAG: polysaccharide deacetylase family protein [Pseudomonadota bacterium]
MSAPRKRLTLSFDNGPFADVTPGVLDALAARDLRASFFVCGKDLRDPARRDLVRRARNAGHRIGNHTLTHAVELGASGDPAAPAREIDEAQALLGELAAPERWFRPYGAGGVLGPRLLSEAAVAHLCAGGYSLVVWNSVPRDWEDPDGWPARALADVEARDWTLVVLHDVPTGAMRALPRFLDDALARGIEITDELPPACVPIRCGARVGALDGLVAPAPAQEIPR